MISGFAPLRGAAYLIAAITVIPVATVMASVFQPEPEIWSHLWHHLLPELLANTFWLVLGVGLGTLLLGVSLAWLTSACEFPGRRLLAWALLLPLALPAYITGFVWLGLLDFTGDIPQWLRSSLGFTWHPPIRSRAGVVVVMILSLYPYVYLAAAAAFRGQGRHLMEAAQTLGVSRTHAFRRVILPIAYPGIMAGLLLVTMETLADFGTVAVFNYDTFTTAIYKTWFSLFSLQAASQLASLLILMVFAVILVESYIRGQRHYAQSPRDHVTMERIHLHGWHAALAATFCWLAFSLAFAVPVLQLLAWSAQVYEQDLGSRYWDFAAKSLLLSTLGTTLVLFFAVILCYAQRLHQGPALRILGRLATLGYAVPGAVLAVGFFIPLAWLDNRLIEVLAGWEIETGQVLSGTLLAMLLAYCARFLAVGTGPVESGLARISPSMDEVALSLGASAGRRLVRIHVPMLRVSLLTGAALTFVDIMKELPITLMTRPFGWDTLAVRVFEMTSEGEWVRAALPAIAIVIAGLVPVIILIRNSEHAHS